MAKARAGMYNCLSLCFSYPSRRLAEVASSGTLSRAWRDLFICPPGGPTNGAMARLIDLLEADSGMAIGERLLDLQIEYHRLFVGPFRPRVCPTESLFLHPDGASLAPPGLEALRTYKREGLTLSSLCQDVPDHIAIELEFMGYLCYRAAGAEENHNQDVSFHYRRRQQAYFQQHIINWVPKLLTDVERATEADFYRSLARATDDFLQWDGSQMGAQFGAEERRSLCQDKTDGRL